MEVVTEKPTTKAVPEGYKRTEVGVIPEDWEIKELGQIGDFKNGINKSKSEFGHGHPFVNLLDVFENRTISRTNGLKLVNTNSAEHSKYDLKKGDVLFVRSSVKPSGVGLTTLIDKALPNTVYSGFIIRFRENGFIHHKYKAFIFDEPGFRNRLIANSSVSANTNISQDGLKPLKIPLPPTLEEQKAIAESLSDVDALIAELNALIEKKQQIKKGAMQQLLTPPEPGQAGKKRLPGFDGEWEEKTFDECFHFLKTGTNSRSDLSDNGGVGYIHYGDIHAKWTDVLNCDEDSIPSIHKNKVTHLPRLEEGDLILADASEDYEGVGAGVEVKNLNGRQVVAGLHTILLRAKDGCIADGYKAYITSTKTVKKSLREIATGTTVYGISKSKLKQVKILLPPTIEEQKAIARILSDMDAEIQALQGKRRKYEKIKQGMMQELLTGKTRLV